MLGYCGPLLMRLSSLKSPFSQSQNIKYASLIGVLLWLSRVDRIDYIRYRPVETSNARKDRSMMDLKSYQSWYLGGRGPQSSKSILSRLRIVLISRVRPISNILLTRDGFDCGVILLGPFLTLLFLITHQRLYTTELLRTVLQMSSQIDNAHQFSTSHCIALLSRVLFLCCRLHHSPFPYAIY